MISTVPPQAKMVIPQHILAHKPAVLDVCYKPLNTPILQQCARCWLHHARQRC